MLAIPINSFDPETIAVTGRKRVMPRPALLLLAAGAGALAACSSDVNPVRDVVVATGLVSEPRPAPDFVTQSRPASTDYAPVGVAPPPRATKPKSAADVKNAEAELDALRASSEGRAAKTRQAGQSAASQAAKPPKVAPAAKPAVAE
jgi:hypothetical protein